MPKEILKGFEFKDVYFAYPESENQILKGVSFTINAGEKIAFVGQNGAGKTTTIKMMSTLIMPTDGEIKVLGYDTKKTI